MIDYRFVMSPQTHTTDDINVQLQDRIFKTRYWNYFISIVVFVLFCVLMLLLSVSPLFFVTRNDLSGYLHIDSLFIICRLNWHHQTTFMASNFLSTNGCIFQQLMVDLLRTWHNRYGMFLCNSQQARHLHIKWLSSLLFVSLWNLKAFYLDYIS